jgi:hypothetical protein
MTSKIRVRISTVFLGLALLELPVSAGWVNPPVPDLGARSWILAWLLYDFVPIFFVVAFVAATLGLVVAAVRRQPMTQFGAEMLLAFGAFALLPAY